MENQKALITKLNDCHPSVQCIIDALEIEPALFSILWQASTSDPEYNRWETYERFKRMARNYVGFEAKRTELQTCAHYEAMMRAIEYLIPDPDLLPGGPDDSHRLERGA
jgi:hypothetical protein